MKRRDVLSYLETHSCVLVREGANHTVYRNPANGLVSTVPRHTEIVDKLVRKICKDLSIPHPFRSES
jgi:mRNA interferase HicA